MKKLLLSLGLLLSIGLVISCGDEEKIDQQQATIDSLSNLLNENESQVQEYLTAFNEIRDNLNVIKQKEHIIDLNTVDTSEMSPDIVSQINSDISLISELMDENKEALSTLKRKMQSSGNKNKELQSMLTLYEQQITQKEAEITGLKQHLDNLNINIENLENQVTNLESDIDTLEQENLEQNQTINEQDVLLHTIYYAVGNKTELKDHFIISKAGILSKLSLDPNFDKTYFTKADYRNLKELPINSKKIDILTQHPESSYTLEEEDNQVSKIIITNQDEFWSLSKFLVVMIK